MSRNKPDHATLVIGIGSDYGDDAAGWRVVDAVGQKKIPAGVRLQRARSPSDLLTQLEGLQRLHVCDACHGAGATGTWRRWSWPDTAIEPVRFSGSHDLGLAAVLALADQLDQLPPEIVVWGIEAGPAIEPEQAFDASLSPEVERAVAEVATRVASELRSSCER